MLAEAWLARGPRREDQRLLRRMAFAGMDAGLDALVRRACSARTSLEQVDLAAHLPADTRRALARLAPETLRVPSGRDVRLDYEDDGRVSASVKLQELFGLAESPRLGPSGTPVTFLLLAPNGRPVQTTRDLRSFWNTTYAEVRKQLRARYPRHPWPEDPWTALPTARTRRQAT